MKRKVGRGRPLGELVKGSLDYVLDQVRTAFDRQFPSWSYDQYVVEVFADHLITRKYGQPPDEYYSVPFQANGDSYVFAAESQWEPVELTYQPQAARASAGGEQATPTAEAAAAGAIEEDASSAGTGTAAPPPPPAAAPVSEAAPSDDAAKQRRGRRLNELMSSGGPRARLLEGKSGSGSRRIQIKGLMTAGVVNGNGRRYSAEVIEAAVKVWRDHLHESAGQGRLKILTGEADHPHEKGHKTAQFIETCVRWDVVDFDGESLDVTGELILTSRGRDVLTLMEAGVLPGGSVRGFYESTKTRVGDHVVEDVTWCEITGADLVGDPSFTNQADLLESRRPAAEAAGTAEGDGDMDGEQLRAFFLANPDLFKDAIQGEVKSMTESQLADMQGQVRKMLGLTDEDDLATALQEAVAAKRELAESRAREAVAGAIGEACKGLTYGAELNTAFRTALEEAKCKTADEVKTLAEAKRKEYDQIASAMRLVGMGRGVQVLGSVLERDTGTPEFARAAHEFSEALVVRQLAPRRNLAEPKTVNERVAQKVLKRFDECYRAQLMAESRQLNETELASDLNLPYSAMRTIIAEVWPTLIATSIFDVDTTDSALANVFFEDYRDVTGKHVTVTDEVVTADHDAWVQMTNRMIEAGTVVVTDTSGATTYVDGTDYVIDYMDGRIYCMSGGSITDGQSLKVDYHFDKVRAGENQPIQRAKMITDSVPLVCRANRLATQITREAILFSRSQIGWDATARTLAGLTAELGREIDRALLYTALSRSLMVPNNSGGTYTAATDPLIKWVEAIGAAKVKVSKRYFKPTFILLSETNSDALGNWDGFTQAGGRADSALNANGFVYTLKGLPCFKTTEFSDGYSLVGNNQVVHYRVYRPGELMGPFPSYDSNGQIIAADQYYVETFDGHVSPVAGKAAHMKVA